MGRCWGRTLRRTVGHGGFTMTASHNTACCVTRQIARHLDWRSRGWDDLADACASDLALIHLGQWGMVVG